MIALGLGLLCASTLHADYKRSYYEGYQLARQGRDWETVATKMTEALQENDREGEQVVLTSANTQPYLPYFYLGLARFHLGDCRSARDNWIKSSVQKKVVLHGREREWFNQFSPICELVVSTEDALKQTQSRLQSLDELGRDADLAKIWNQDAALAPAVVKLRQQYDRTRDGLQQARAAKIDEQLALLTGVKADAVQVADQSDTLVKTARGRRDDLVAARTAAEKRLAEEKKAAETTTAVNGANGGTAAGSGGKPSETKPPEIKPAETKTTETKTLPGKLVTPMAPPDALRAVAQQYAQGHYREARDGLQAQAVPAEWRAHAALLRAASAFSLYYAEGQKDRRLLDEAIHAVQACAQANHDLRPSTRLYAPPFIEFFDRHARR